MRHGGGLAPARGHSHVGARGRGLWRKGPSPLDPHPKHGGRHPSPMPPRGTKGRDCGPSPLETPPGVGRGSGSGKRSRGRPICNTCVRRTFWCGGRTDLRFEYSAAGRSVSSLVGSAWRPTSVLGELTDKAVNSSLIFFLFHRARRIFFLMSQKENGGCVPAAVRRVPLRSKENVRNIPMGKAHFRIRSRMVSPCFPVRQSRTLRFIPRAW